MGSEGTPITRFHITGFKKFHGVARNPTEEIVGKVKSFMKEYGLPQGCTLESSTVLETAGEGALGNLTRLLDCAAAAAAAAATAVGGGDIDDEISFPSSSSSSCSSHRKLGDFIPIHDALNSSPPHRVIWVHFGVNSGATKFAIERRAVNEATFRCPDEMGWQPQRVAIVAEDGAISESRETTLAAAEIVNSLTKKGFEVTLSDDAGRFVCNYVYYQSLRHAAANGTHSIFVHVPLFSKIEEEIQMQFVACLLEILATI